MSNFYGNFFIRGTDLLALPNVTEDTAFNLEIQHEVRRSRRLGTLCVCWRLWMCFLFGRGGHGYRYRVRVCCHQEALLPGSVIGIQAALLYTTSSGERRINVHTMSLPVTTVLTELFKKVCVVVELP